MSQIFTEYFPMFQLVLLVLKCSCEQDKLNPCPKGACIAVGGNRYYCIKTKGKNLILINTSNKIRYYKNDGISEKIIFVVSSYYCEGALCERSRGNSTVF